MRWVSNGDTCRYPDKMHLFLIKEMIGRHNRTTGIFSKEHDLESIVLKGTSMISDL